MRRWQKWVGYGWALAATGVATAAGLAMTSRFDLVNIAMVYLLVVVVIALRFSYGPAIVVSLTVIQFRFIEKKVNY